MAIKYSDGSSSADGRIIQIANAQIAGNNIRTQTNAPNAWKKVVSNTDEICQISFTPKSATSKSFLKGFSIIFKAALQARALSTPKYSGRFDN